MEELEKLRAYGIEIRTRLTLRTMPLAIKMLKDVQDIPEGAQRPLKDFGYHLSQCQAFAMSRRDGISVAVFREDGWCPEPIIGFGFAEPPDYFLKGHSKYPYKLKSLEAGSNWAQTLPRLEFGKFMGIVSAPLCQTNFTPDLIMLYANSAQMTQILQSARFQTGLAFSNTISASAACVYATVLPLQRGEYQVTFPCAGDREKAMAHDDETIFTFPINKLEDLMEGVRYLDSHNRGLPVKVTMKNEYAMTESYTKLAKMVGVQI